MNRREQAKGIITEDSSHMFIYGLNNKEREELLKECENKHPYKFASKEPTTIYVDDIAIPNVEKIHNDLDVNKVNRIAITQLEFLIAYKIMDKIRMAEEQNPECADELTNMMGKLTHRNFNNISDVVNALKKSTDFYSTAYGKYMETGDMDCIHEEFNSLDFQFMPNLPYFIEIVKKQIHYDSFFNLIIDRKKEIPTAYEKAINTLMYMRCNRGLSVKVACEPDEWKTMVGMNGEFVEYIHDYSIIELDDSFKKHMEKRRKESHFFCDDEER